MKNLFLNSSKIRNGGYIALMATIVISLMLLVMIVNEGFSGWMTRFVVLGTEAKEQANALAEGCADQAIASLITDPSYLGNTTSNTPGGNCKTFSISQADLAAGLVTIKTQAVVRDAFANLELLQNVNNIHLGSIPTAPNFGTLIVQTLVNNPASGAQMTPADFTMNIASVNPSKPSFGGSATGVIVTIPTNGGTVVYSVSESPVPGFAASLTAQCAGSIKGGDIKSCTVSNNPVTTSLTLIANITNNDGTGTLVPSDISLYIDGVVATVGHAYTVSAGTHTASATVPSGYFASPWGYQCSSSGSATLNLGDNKICIITLDDIPPPAPTCADTVMMLDRSGSMFDNSAWIPDEKSAAKALVDLYASVTSSHPLVGFGRFGDSSRTSADIVSTLQNTYSSIKTAIDNGLADNNSYTNLADAISVGTGELNSSRHDTTKQKVLILISDGDPNQPSGTVNSSKTLAPYASSATTTLDEWSAVGGTKTAVVASDDNDTSYIAPALSGESFAFTNANIPASATNIVVTFHAFAKKGNSSSASIALLAENASVQSIGSAQSVTSQSSYNDYSWAMNTNPITGAAWTVSEVNAWTTKFGVVNTSAGGGNPRVTQMYVSVSYQLTGSTAYVSPSQNGTASGDGNGFESNPTGAYADGGAAAFNSKGEGDRHRYWGYNFGLPVGVAVTGIEVRPDWWADSTAGNNSMDVELSWNGGNSWTDNKNEDSESISDSNNKIVGSAGDTWGRNWNASTEFTSNNFRVRVTANCSGFLVSPSCTQRSFSLDWVPVRLYYATAGTSGNLTPISQGPSNAWPSVGATSVQAAVANDGDLSYVASSGSSLTADELYFFPGAGIPANASNISVEVHAQAKETGGSSGSLRFTAERGGSLQTSSSHSLGSSYVEEEWDMNSNPFGGNWTASDVNNWNVRFGIENASAAGSSVRVSQVEAIVRYSIVTTATEAALNAADSSKQGGTNIFTIYFGNGSPSLLAELASGAKAYAGHENGSYNDPGGSGTADTGLVAPSSNAVDTGGDNNGFEASPTRAYADDDSPAQNINGAGDRHRYFGYNFTIPPGANITGIEVRPNWWVDSTSGFGANNSLSIELSYDGGAHWTSAKTDTNDSTSHSHTATLGSGSDLWGRSSWSASELSSANFRVRVTSNSNSSSRDFYLDYLPMRVTYTVNTENGDGDNFFIAPTSADMKGIFEFIGNQVCPAINNVAAANPPTSASLFVITQVINNNSGVSTAASFSVAVVGGSASPNAFAGSDTPGKLVTLDPGTYAVTQSSAPQGYTTTYTDSCSSSASSNIAAGESRVCVITNDDIPPPPPPPNLTITPGLWQEVPDTNP